MKKVIAIFLVLALVLSIAGGAAYFLLKPEELKGSEDVYKTITLQLKDDLFYDVRVPVEAVLESTDGGTIYSYDLLTVGVQDIEPTAYCKVKIGDRWVFASSKDGWLRATLAGFEKEEAYTGSYDTEYTKWEDNIPDVVMELDEDMLAALWEGTSYTFGGEEFVTSQIAYGTFDVAVDRALRKMATLYKQPINYGMLTGDRLWVTCNMYTVAIAPINYNTCLVVSAYGEEGKQYAAALMGGQR